MRIFFKAFQWNRWCDDPELAQQGYHIEAYGHNKNSEPVLVRIEDFTPYALLELPEVNGYTWTQGDALLFHEYFRLRMKSNAPLKCALTHRKRLYYYRGTKTYPLLQVSFKTEDGLRHIQNICKYPLEISGLPKIQLVPREFDVGQIKKMLTLRKTTYITWMSAEAEELGVDDERRIGNPGAFTHEYIASWRTITQVPDEECATWSVSPLLFSWDIEVRSNNPRVFPNPLNINDQAMMIGVTLQRLNQPDTRRKYTLTYGPCDDVPGVEVRRFATEKEMIFGFCTLINETNPDVLLGYNILGFDYSYLNRRLMNTLDAWPPIGRVGDRKPELRELKWQSSAYGFQTLTFLDPNGRISMDMLPLIQRDYKLDKYTLDFVSEYFLKKNKIGIDMKDMFRYFSITLGCCFPDIITSLGNGDTRVLTDTSDASKYWPLHTSEAVSEAMDAYTRTKGTPVMEEEVLSVYRKHQGAVMAIVALYCAQDTILPIELFQVLNTWVNCSELATIVKVPIMDTFTRGQQVRVFSQFYDELVESGYYVDTRENPELLFTGGFVHHPDPGIYSDVLSFDFASLYPNLIRAYNICYTTYVPDHITGVPDSMCNILEWDEAGGEEASGVEEEEGDAVANETQGDEDKLLLVTKAKHFRFRFIKKEHQEGLYPRFISQLLIKRADTRACQKNAAKGSFNWQVLEARQLGLKVSANSCYGFLGVKKGKMSFIEAAICVTAMGRKHIHEIMALVKQDTGVQVYGDSVTAGTPIPVYDGVDFGYRRIADLVNFDQLFSSESTEKQEVQVDGLQVWSEKGWTRVKRVIRHKVNKKMYRVLTHTGCVDVTEDHSLLKPDGEEIAPLDVDVGTKLLHHPLPIVTRDYAEYTYKGKVTRLTEEEAYLWGMFYAEGSCGRYDCPSGVKHSWAISNQDHVFLDKTLLCATKVESEKCTFKILDTMDSSNADKLVAGGDVKYLVQKYRHLFYTGNSDLTQWNSYKIVPDCVLWAPIAIKQAFFQGYYDGDGDKTDNKPTRCRFDNKGEIGAASLLHIARSLEWKTSINDRKDKPDVYRINCTKALQRKCPLAVKKIYELPHIEQWVYDLETENHHFAAGIGDMIVHNTDSCMVRFPGVPRDKIYEMGEQLSEKYSSMLPKPMRIEFERAYAVFFSLTAKRYACVVLRKDGTPETNADKMYRRGVVLSRRDNCILLREIYKDILLCILYERGMEEAIIILMNYINLLMSRSIPRKKFVVIKALNRVYKSDSNVMSVYSQQLKAWGKPAEAGDRLEYCFYETGEKLQGRKMVPPEMMAEEPDKYKIDRLYYFEKAILKPIQQLFEIGFHARKTFMKEMLKKLVAKQTLTQQINEMGRRARTIKIRF